MFPNTDISSNKARYFNLDFVIPNLALLLLKTSPYYSKKGNLDVLKTFHALLLSIGRWMCLGNKRNVAKNFEPKSKVEYHK